MLLRKILTLGTIFSELYYYTIIPYTVLETASFRIVLCPPNTSAYSTLLEGAPRMKSMFTDTKLTNHMICASLA